MRYSFVSFSAPSASLAELFELAGRYDYDGIELRIGAGHGHGMELDTARPDRDRARAQSSAAARPIVCVSTGCRMANPADVGEQVDQARRAANLAADLGAAFVRVFGGPVPDGTTRAAAQQALVDGLRAAGEHAATRDVTVLLETHDDWTDPGRLRAVVEQVDHPAVGLLWDVMHPLLVSGASLRDTFEVLGPWVRHVHIHDGHRDDGRPHFAPIGTGRIDHREVLRLLGGARYQGFLSGEWIRWEAPEVHLPREREAMRRYEAEPVSS